MTNNNEFLDFLNNYIDDLLQEHYHFDDKEYYNKQLLAVDSSYNGITYSQDWLSLPTRKERNQAKEQARLVFEDKINKKSIQNIKQYLKKTAWIFQYVTQADYDLSIKPLFEGQTKVGNHTVIIKVNHQINKGHDHLLTPQFAAEIIFEFCKQMANKNVRKNRQHSHYKGQRQWSTIFFDNLKGKTSELETAVLLHEPIDSLDLQIYTDKYDTDGGVDITPINTTIPYQVKSFMQLAKNSKDKSQPEFNISIDQNEFNNSQEQNCSWMFTTPDMDMYYFDRNTLNPLLNDVFTRHPDLNKLKLSKEFIELLIEKLQFKHNIKIKNNYMFKTVDEVKTLITQSYENKDRYQFNFHSRKGVNNMDYDFTTWKISA